MKFFRSFRIMFINEGKTRKYLLYAIGEILLVMIGIVLAFQVDNWNDSRLRGKSEQTIYQNIFDQLENDRDLLLREREFDSLNRVYVDFVAEAFAANDRSKTDSIGKVLVHLLQYSDYDKQSALYSAMVSSGEIKLVTQRTVITGLRELEEQFIYLNRMEDIHYDIIIRWISPQLSKVARYSTGKVIDEEGLYNHEIENTLLTMMYIMDEKEMVYNNTIGRIDLILDDLKSYL